MRLSWIGVLVLATSCGEVAAVQRTFPVAVSATDEALVTDSGWAVTLTEARLSLSSARFYTGAVPSLTRRFNPLDVLVSSAYAHPGHYVPGEALGELLADVEVNLLGPGVTWGEATGATGAYGSMEVTVGAAGLHLAGTATKDGQTVSFDTGEFAPPKAISAIAFTHEMTKSAGQVRLAASLRTILSRVDFAQVGAGASPLDRQSPAFNGFARGIEDATAWRASWETP